MCMPQLVPVLLQRLLICQCDLGSHLAGKMTRLATCLLGCSQYSNTV